MKLHISRPWAIALVVFLLAAGALFLTLSSRFGGPSLVRTSTYELTAMFADTQGLAKKSDVLVRGVKVGEVGAIDVRDGLAHVRLDLQPRYAPVDRAATVRVAQKTVLGEAYVNLIPSRRSSDPLPDGSKLARENVLASVELDEALGALDEPARRDLTSMLDTLARGAADPATADRVNATLGEIDSLTGALRRLTATLKGQESTITATVQDSRIVLRELGRREEQVTRIVSDGRATLEALGGRQRALDAGLRELPQLLVSARTTLDEARPLLREARPLVDDLRRAAPALTPAIADLRPVAGDGASLVRGLPRLARTAVPVLRRADGVVKAARPVARALSPTFANLVPAVRYVEPRRRALAAWFSQTAGLGRQGDAKGRWARFFIFVDPQTAAGIPGPRQGNAYTPPDDALNNQAHKPGSYSRLLPFKP